METEVQDFSWALKMMKAGEFVRRSGWNNNDIRVRIQFPDDNSKMTKPYIYMEKGDQCFPLDMSCESLMAEDWELIM